MHNPKENQNLTTNDPAWDFLAAYSLSELLVNEESGEEHTYRLLFQATRGLSIPAECLNNIESTLRWFFRKEIAHLNQEKLESTVTIRLFCQKKRMEMENSAKTASNFYAQPTPQPTQIIRQSDTKMSGGWGYFLIERGGNIFADSLMSSYRLVDLYLYKEG